MSFYLLNICTQKFKGECLKKIGRYQRVQFSEPKLVLFGISPKFWNNPTESDRQDKREGIIKKKQSWADTKKYFTDVIYEFS